MSVVGTLSELSVLGAPGRALGARVHLARGIVRAAALVAHNTAFFPLVFPNASLRADEAEEREITRRLVALWDTDWRNVEEGIYPAELARDFSWRRLAAAYPRMALDAPGLRRRAHENRYEELPEGTDQYPKYYRRNFHFQKEGYLGSDSAAIYEPQVEFLFAGTADAMRRQLLPPLVRHFRGRDFRSLRVLDLACGTGPLLRMLAQVLPGARLFGVDLSPHYVARARAALKDVVDLSLVVENAEALPFKDGYFDAVTNVFLFHELPPDVRDRVLAEVSRALAPGGLFVFADSIQLADAPALARQLDHFPRQFHEPFYRQYVRDDLAARMQKAGLEVVDRQQHFMTKLVVCRKPVAH